MIYIYDILLNFSDGVLYEFYEWNTNDDIQNMKKIKMVKIDKQDFEQFLHYKIKISTDFLLKIFKSCEVYSNKGVETLDYCCLFSDGSRVLAIEFSKNGESICKSKLLLDEEEEIAYLASNLAFTPLEYTVVKEENSLRFLTRRELKMKKYLTAELQETFQSKNYHKLKFLYYEYYDEVVNSYQVMVDKLIHSMDNYLDDKHVALYQLLRLSHKKKQV